MNLSWLDAMKILKSSTILVVPSRIESLTTVIKEAFYLKIPVVSTSVGGIPELIDNGKTGILVDTENSEMLSSKINELLEDTKMQSKLISNAYEFVTKNFTWDVILPKYAKFYENLLSD